MIRRFLPKRYSVHYCEDQDKVDELRAKTETMEFGVVVLHKDLGYGTDVRFKGHPECVVWAEKVPTPYDYLQFCGRS